MLFQRLPVRIGDDQKPEAVQIGEIGIPVVDSELFQQGFSAFPAEKTDFAIGRAAFRQIVDHPAEHGGRNRVKSEPFSDFQLGTEPASVPSPILQKRRLIEVETADQQRQIIPGLRTAENIAGNHAAIAPVSPRRIGPDMSRFRAAVSGIQRMAAAPIREIGIGQPFQHRMGGSVDERLTAADFHQLRGSVPVLFHHQNLNSFSGQGGEIGYFLNVAECAGSDHQHLPHIEIRKRVHRSHFIPQLLQRGGKRRSAAVKLNAPNRRAHCRKHLNRDCRNQLRRIR